MNRRTPKLKKVLLLRLLFLKIAFLKRLTHILKLLTIFLKRFTPYCAFRTHFLFRFIPNKHKKCTFLQKKCIFLYILTSFSSLPYYLCSVFQKNQLTINPSVCIFTKKVVLLQTEIKSTELWLFAITIWDSFPMKQFTTM